MAVDALRRRRPAQLQERLAAGGRWVDTGLVFTTKWGTPVEHSTVIRKYHKLLKHAGIRHQRIHDLRHAFASVMLAEGVHPRVVQGILGHANISLTLDTYSHVVPGLQEDAANRIAVALGSKPK